MAVEETQEKAVNLTIWRKHCSSYAKMLTKASEQHTRNNNNNNLQKKQQKQGHFTILFLGIP